MEKNDSGLETSNWERFLQVVHSLPGRPFTRNRQLSSLNLAAVNYIKGEGRLIQSVLQPDGTYRVVTTDPEFSPRKMTAWAVGLLIIAAITISTKTGEESGPTWANLPPPSLTPTVDEMTPTLLPQPTRDATQLAVESARSRYETFMSPSGWQTTVTDLGGFIEAVSVLTPSSTATSWVSKAELFPPTDIEEEKSLEVVFPAGETATLELRTWNGISTYLASDGKHIFFNGGDLGEISNGGIVRFTPPSGGVDQTQPFFIEISSGQIRGFLTESDRPLSVNVEWVP